MINQHVVRKLRIGTVERSEYDSLTNKEKRIYDSIRDSFPSTSHNCAYDKAIQGGTNFQFICK